VTDKLREDAAKASRAKMLMDDPLIVEAFSELEASYIRLWRESAARDAIGREKLFIAVNVVGKVREHLQLVIANGSVADEELRRLSAEAERRRKFNVVV
jgi:hypothetical protein